MPPDYELLLVTKEFSRRDKWLNLQLPLQGGEARP